jgi:biopolymer transport protein ExbB
MTALDLLLSDGARALPILLASLAGSYVIIERLLAVRNLRREANDLVASLKALGDGEDPVDPQSFLAKREGRAAAVFGHAIGRSDVGTHDVVRLTESAWADEVDRLERPLTIGVIAAVAAFLAGLLPFLVDLLELTRTASDPAGGILLPSASAVVSAFVGCAVGGMLAVGLFVARREMQKLRASARSLVPEFVHAMIDPGRDESRLLKRRAKGVLSPVAPREDEFFRPKAPAGLG